MSERLPCAILGATGYIGQHFARLLADHPAFEPVVLGGSERSAGRRLEELWQVADSPPPDLGRTRVASVTPARLVRQNVRAAFGALPSGTAGAFEAECRRRGIAVFSNSSDHRMDPGVPLLVPEVNASHLSLLGRPGIKTPLVTNPNCTATGLVLALAPLLPVLRPRWVNVATYQALSGAGFPGVPSLSVTDNVVPYVAEEEEKVAVESNRILGAIRDGRVRAAGLPVWAQCVRVPVRDGHLESVTLSARRTPDRGAILEAFRRFDPLEGDSLPTAPHPPIEIRPEVDRPQPLRDRWAGKPDRARGMAAVVGRLRWDPPILRFFVLSHNAVRGGAGGSVLNAELALARGYLRLPRERSGR